MSSVITSPPTAYVEAAAFAANRTLPPSLLIPIYVPVAFVVIYNSNKTGLIPYATLQKQVAQLSRAFSAQEAVLAKYKSATDSHLRFYLHSVQYVEDDEWHANCALANYQPMLKLKFNRDPSRYYNVMVCNVAAELGLGWLPYHSFTPFPCSTFPLRPGMQCPPSGLPMTESHYMQGTLVDSSLLPGNSVFNGRWSQGDILTHETGHYFGLRHLYAGGCVNYGTKLGYTDDIPDTPQQVGNPSGTCAQLSGLRSCPGKGPLDDNANYMGIAADSCRSHFTPGQVAFMRSITHSIKPTLSSQQAPACVTLIDSTDEAPDDFMCASPPVLDAAHSTTPRLWCRTNALNASQWGFACCMNSTGGGCEQLQTQAPAFSALAAASSLLTKPIASAPTPNPITQTPTLSGIPALATLSAAQLYSYAATYYQTAAFEYANFQSGSWFYVAQTEEARAVYLETLATAKQATYNSNSYSDVPSSIPTPTPTTSSSQSPSSQPTVHAATAQGIGLPTASVAGIAGGGAGALAIAGVGVWILRRRRRRRLEQEATNGSKPWAIGRNELAVVVEWPHHSGSRNPAYALDV